MKSKKGLWAFDVGFSVVQLIFVVLVTFTMVIFLSLMIRSEMDVKDVETDVLAYRFLYSPNGFNYKDNDIGRSYPGYIDIDKFNDNKVNEFFNFKKSEMMAAKLTLINRNDKSEKTVYFNKKWFDAYKPRAAANVGGSGGAEISTKMLPVTITDSKMSFKDQGILKIEIVTPNT